MAIATLVSTQTPAAVRRGHLAAVMGAAASSDHDEDVELTPTGLLPDPRPLVANLTRCVVEALAGVRDLDQISRWIDADVYASLRERIALRLRARDATGPTGRATRPRIALGSVRLDFPAEGVVEAVSIVHEPHRSKAVVIRLVGRGGRWIATLVRVL